MKDCSVHGADFEEECQECLDIAIEESDKLITPRQSIMVDLENAYDCLVGVPGISPRADIVETAVEFLGEAIAALKWEPGFLVLEWCRLCEEETHTLYDGDVCPRCFMEGQVLLSAGVQGSAQPGRKLVDDSEPPVPERGTS